MSENIPTREYARIVLLPYIVYMFLFIGTGFLSGAVVHYPMNPAFFLLVGAFGALLFAAGSTVQEAYFNKKNLKEEGILLFIAYSVVLSIGIGMISGGIQHFEQYPVYASYLIPVGIAISYVSFVLKNNFRLRWMQQAITLLVGVILLVPMWFGLVQIAVSMEPAEHDHGSATVSTATSKVFVALEGEGSLAVMDPVSGKVTSKIGLSGAHDTAAPHNVQVAPDGKTLWVTANVAEHHASVPFLPVAVASEGHEETASGQDTVIVIDPVTEKILQRLPLGSGQHLAHVVLTPDSRLALVTAQQGDAVFLIDARTYAVAERIELPKGSGAHGLRITPDGSRAYIALLEGKGVAMLDLQTRQVTVKTLPGKAVQTAITPDGSKVFVTLYDTKQIAMHDRRKDTWEMLDMPKETKGPVQAYPSEDGRLLYIADQGLYFGQPKGDSLYVLDIAAKTFARGTAGDAPHGVVAGGGMTFVTNIEGGTVSIMEGTMETTEVPVGKEPNGITYWQQ